MVFMTRLSIVFGFILLVSVANAQLIPGNYELLDTKSPLPGGNTCILHKTLTINENGTFILTQHEPESSKKQGSNKGTWKIKDNQLELNSSKSKTAFMVLTVEQFQLKYICEVDHMQIFNLLDD